MLCLQRAFIGKQIQLKWTNHIQQFPREMLYNLFMMMLSTEVKNPENLRSGLVMLGFDPFVYLDRARIFRRFRFSLRIRFLRHFALMFPRALKIKFQSVCSSWKLKLKKKQIYLLVYFLDWNEATSLFVRIFYNYVKTNV